MHSHMQQHFAGSEQDMLLQGAPGADSSAHSASRGERESASSRCWGTPGRRQAAHCPAGCVQRFAGGGVGAGEDATSQKLRLSTAAVQQAFLPACILVDRLAQS